MPYFYYTDSIDEAADVLAGKTPYMGVRLGLYKDRAEQNYDQWRHEFHLDKIRVDLHKHEIPVVQAKQYILDRLLEEQIEETPVPKEITKARLENFAIRNYPWLGIDAHTMNRAQMISEILREFKA